MNISNNTNLQTNLSAQQAPIVEKLKEKKDLQKVPEVEQTQEINKNKKKKTGVALKLEELNKQKVTLKALEDTVKDIKKDTKENKTIDIKDTNRDGKVSNEEKQKAEDKKDKALSLVKKVVDELKKENKFEDTKPEEFKGISKMINDDIIKSKDTPKINKFLD